MQIFGGQGTTLHTLPPVAVSVGESKRAGARPAQLNVSY
jgi:hypothetical protein